MAGWVPLGLPGLLPAVGLKTCGYSAARPSSVEEWTLLSVLLTCGLTLGASLKLCARSVDLSANALACQD